MSPIFAALALSLLPSPVAAAASKNPETLVYLQRSDVASLDPARPEDVYSQHVVVNLYEALIEPKGGSLTDFEPRLATVVPTRANGRVSADGRVWRFTIREGVRFHDGSVLVFEDARYSLLRHLLSSVADASEDSLAHLILGYDPAAGDKGGAGSEMLRRAENAVSVEGRDLVVRLPRASAAFLPALAAYGRVVSKSWCVAHGDWDGTAAGLPALSAKSSTRFIADHAMGTGPFALERWDRGTRTLVLARNEAYWRGPAKLKRVVLKSVPELSTRVLMLKNGDADVIAGSIVEWPVVTGLEGVDVYDGLQALLRNPLMFFNFRVDPAGNPDLGSGRLDGEGVPPDFFADKDVRRGFAHAMDAERYVREVIRGRGRVASGFLPPGLPGYSASGLEFKHDRALAERHFRRAFGGKIWEKGFKLTVLVNEGSAWRPALVNILKKEIEAINPKFRVETRVVDWATMLARAAKRQVPLYIQGMASAIADPAYFARAFLHSGGSFASRLGYSNPEADRLILRAEAELDPAAREVIYTRLQRLAVSDVPFMPIAEPQGDILRVSRSWVKGYHFSPVFPGAPETSDYYELRKE